MKASYDEAVKDCEAKVKQIVAECKRNNIKYTDPHFDLDDKLYCLKPLTVDKDSDAEADYQSTAPQEATPACAKRIGDIFEKPKFYAGGGPNIRSTRQGAEGDCWFISSLGSLCVDEEDPLLIEKICPVRARNERVGVYGFVFYRDGEWFSEIVDDKLYLSTPDYDDCTDEKRIAWDRSHSRLDVETRKKEFGKTFQCNSDALFYGSSADPNETWVPLLEKAFAKAHGDYGAIDGGLQGEAVEDLTGGVTTMILSADVLDVDELWTDGLLKVNKQYLFGAMTRTYENSNDINRQGIEDSHAYTVMKAVEYNGERLVMIKNPWGESEWSGPWSDGSKEWTPEALKDLEFQFGDDGIFWMPYEDFLMRYDVLNRTRLFSPEWHVSHRWTTVQVPWSGEYNDTRFEFTIPKKTRAVIVLSKLDDRYFQGLTGQYIFDLAFRLHESGEEKHLVRGYASGNRSATTELILEPGTYDVLLQISAMRFSGRPKLEDIVKQNWLSRREKLIQIGLSYDLAQAMGQIDIADKVDSNGDKPKEAPTATSVNGEAAKNLEPVSEPSKDLAPPSPVSNAGAGFEAEPNPPDVDDKSSVAGEAGSKTPDDKPADSKPQPDEPWNATCVVGLRVFCYKTEATIRVVTPDTADLDNKAKLDVDDPEKDAAEKGL